MYESARVRKTEIRFRFILKQLTIKQKGSFMKKSSYSIMLSIAFMLTVFSGCGRSNASVNTINGNALEKSQLLQKGSSIYLVNGGDGMKKIYLSEIRGEEISKGSGLSAINIAYKQLRDITPNVILENKVLSEKEALEIAKLNKSDYVLYSRVETWTDPLGVNCTQYYMDEAVVVLSLYSTKDEKLLNTIRLSDKDCPSKLNGLPLSAGSPERLYEKLFSQWIYSIFLVKI